MPGIRFAFVASIRVARKRCGFGGVRIVRDPMRRGSRGQKTEEEERPKFASVLGQGRHGHKDERLRRQSDHKLSYGRPLHNRRGPHW